MKSKTVFVSKIVTIPDVEVDVDVEVDPSDFDTDDLIEALQERGYPVADSRREIEELYYATRGLQTRTDPAIYRRMCDLIATLYGRAA